MKQLWRYLTCGLVCGLAACSFAEERVASPTTSQPSAATPIAGAATPGRPTPTFVPTGSQPPASQPAAGSAAPIVLDNPVWQGSYLRSSGNTEYGGRTAAWIYGSSTQFSTMQATFSLETQPRGTAQLSIEGMDSEGAAKTPIRIRVNETEIFNGPNPLPDDDLPLETGTWSTYTWSFDAALLRPGQNTIRISNLAQGTVGRPPFFMLDYAEISF
ncbi:MAG TPA: polysaccharide lyase family protein [Herpetosiphonaceae bacterium]